MILIPVHGNGQVSQVGHVGQVVSRTPKNINMTGQMCQVGQFGQVVHERFDSSVILIPLHGNGQVSQVGLDGQTGHDLSDVSSQSVQSRKWNTVLWS